jgi:hypothetical protein
MDDAVPLQWLSECLSGTNAKCRNVRFCAALGVRADMTRTSLKDR